LTVIGAGDLGNLVWDVTKGQKGLLGHKLEPGFESDAIKIQCDPIWADSRLVDEFGYQTALARATKLGGMSIPYGGAGTPGVE
jgi:hypothetical protein